MLAAIMRIYIDVVAIVTMQPRPLFGDPQCRKRI